MMLYLSCKSLNSTSSVTLNTYSHVSSTSSTNNPNTSLNKIEYLSLSKEITKCFEINNRNPKKYGINNKNMT